MADRPILFSGAMVRALLAGTKTQTRRLLKPQPKVLKNGSWYRPFPRDRSNWQYALGGIIHAYTKLRIVEGDRLWVRETWSHTGDHVFSISEARRSPFGHAIYQADENPDYPHAKFWPSIHMPREFSRMTLIVTDVRVERLQNISEADAIAEGIERHHSGWMPYSTAFYEADGVTPANYHVDPRESYRSLWNKINGFGAWEANPWIAAYTFTVIKQNIDQVEKVAA
ncbi:hypothetical protein CN200_16315 [Sinorhizobium meliloti]|uniref:hypothetical protein n=1 Tax=Rhizobium meliloti TaxID=382 RepID=UPI000FD5B772|nr:hypothetical protein [Sinorhizobium meliloti]RVI16110.1 hypothetical protein CN200_16315 [Sinorhizobium meliloti]RVN88456.1 hypothetical protein CN107_13920 [Sinorhizobium meliloti]RVO08682.1 hypothetical protein CN103_17035 [Sinorhizobium meliloti]